MLTKCHARKFKQPEELA